MTDMTALKAESLTIFATVIKAATDPSLEAKALADIKAMYSKMQTTVDKHLATASDPELKAAMTAFIDQIKTHQAELAAAGNDLQKAVDGLDNPETEAATDKMEALCS